MDYDSEVVVGRLVWPALKCRNEGKEMPNKSEGLPIEHSRKINVYLTEVNSRNGRTLNRKQLPPTSSHVGNVSGNALSPTRVLYPTH